MQRQLAEGNEFFGAPLDMAQEPIRLLRLGYQKAASCTAA